MNSVSTPEPAEIYAMYLVSVMAEKPMTNPVPIKTKPTPPAVIEVKKLLLVCSLTNL